MKIFCLFLIIALPVYADVQFDGVDDLLTQASTLGSFVAEDAFTVMLYLKSTGSDFAGTECYEGVVFVTDSGYADAIITGRTGLAGETACAYTISGESVFHTLFGSETSLPAGWHQYALRLEAGTLTLFVDGISVATAGSVGNLNTGELTTKSLSYGMVGLPSPDRFTELKTYNVALSNEEILRLGGSRLRSVDRTTPTGYWTLEDCPEGATGTGPFRDLTGNNRPLTGNNGPTCVGAEFVSRPWGIQ